MLTPSAPMGTLTPDVPLVLLFVGAPGIRMYGAYTADDSHDSAAHLSTTHYILPFSEPNLLIALCCLAQLLDNCIPQHTRAAEPLNLIARRRHQQATSGLL